MAEEPKIMMFNGREYKPRRKKKLDELTVGELKDEADRRRIDLEGATRKDDILEKLGE